MKRCSKCKEEKALESFGRDRNRRDGLNGYCKECARIINAKWREDNYEKAKEATRLSAARRYARDPKGVQAAVEKWQLNNIDKVRATRARRYAKKREQIKQAVAEWRLNNIEKVRAIHHRRRARKAGAPGIPPTAAQETAIFIAWRNRCAYCGKLAETLDHVVPLSRGGAHDTSNLLPACQTCNYSKHTQDVDKWMARRGLDVDAILAKMIATARTIQT